NPLCFATAIGLLRRNQEVDVFNSCVFRWIHSFLLPHLQFNVHIEALETMEANNSFLPSTASSVQLRNS
ncbi:hypothetical protein, partial [Trichocoleus sp. FACHB-832]|uniref:hypothetical protein n=1 Tax=Trichocoleus sp. FACHB-832 TaxID=2692875 RepID=UPI001A7E9693